MFLYCSRFEDNLRLITNIPSSYLFPIKTKLLTRLAWLGHSLYVCVELGLTIQLQSGAFYLLLGDVVAVYLAGGQISIDNDVGTSQTSAGAKSDKIAQNNNLSVSRLCQTGARPH